MTSISLLAFHLAASYQHLTLEKLVPVAHAFTPLISHTASRAFPDEQTKAQRWEVIVLQRGTWQIKSQVSHVQSYSIFPSRLQLRSGCEGGLVLGERATPWPALLDVPEPLGAVGAVFGHLEGKRPRECLMCEALAVGSGCRWAEGGETRVQRSERGLNIPLRKRTAVAPLHYSFKIPSVKRTIKITSRPWIITDE